MKEIQWFKIKLEDIKMELIKSQQHKNKFIKCNNNWMSYNQN